MVGSNGGKEERKVREISKRGDLVVWRYLLRRAPHEIYIEIDYL